VPAEAAAARCREGRGDDDCGLPKKRERIDKADELPVHNRKGLGNPVVLLGSFEWLMVLLLVLTSTRTGMCIVIDLCDSGRKNGWLW
jgi:hypothetical protein